MELKEVQRNWDAFGRTDPLWAILARPDKRHGKWRDQDFFACGEEEVDRILRHVDSLAFPLRRGRALDFGCGVGRLTQALGRHFDRCDGIDIAPSMIELARKYNRHGNKCHYSVNDANDLALFNDDTFDLVYSSLVLQHMRPEYSQKYVQEFLRVLAPGGLLIFQIPSRPMPDSEQPYRALISAERTSLSAKPGARITLLVRVKNVSNFTWPAVNLGNRWRNERGELLIGDDARARLPVGMQPAEEVQLSLTVTAPQEPARYLLELDLVHESVVWFQEMGSATTQIPCQVSTTGRKVLAFYRGLNDRLRATRGYRLGSKVYRRLLRGLHSGAAGPFLSSASHDPAGSPAGDAEPVMEMYGVPQDVLLNLIQTNGGKAVDIQRDYSAGKDWESFRYYVTKP